MFDVPDGVGEVTEGVEDHRVHQHCHLRPVTRVNVVLYQILEREYLHIICSLIIQFPFIVVKNIMLTTLFYILASSCRSF